MASVAIMANEEIEEVIEAITSAADGERLTFEPA
jgi:hypothetical protein